MKNIINIDKMTIEELFNEIRDMDYKTPFFLSLNGIQDEHSYEKDDNFRQGVWIGIGTHFALRMKIDGSYNSLIKCEICYSATPLDKDALVNIKLAEVVALKSCNAKDTWIQLFNNAKKSTNTTIKNFCKMM